MATIVFISGSRSIKTLSPRLRQRLSNIVQRSLSVVVGDAYGADELVQQYFADTGYRSVEVYCSGATHRNNLGSWKVVNIAAPNKATGRDFYTVKDRAMAKVATCGLVIWDGRSAGSFANIQELVRLGAPCVVYHSGRDAFQVVKSVEDAEALVS